MDIKRLLIVAIFFFVVPGFVLWYTRKRAQSVEDYMVAGRSVGPIATALTAISAGTSAGLFVGAAGMAYKFGWGGATWQLGAFFGTFITWLFIAPRIRQVTLNLKVMTVPELFAKRYGSDKFYAVAAFWIVVFTIPMLVVQLRSGALIMEAYSQDPLCLVTGDHELGPCCLYNPGRERRDFLPWNGSWRCNDTGNDSIGGRRS